MKIGHLALWTYDLERLRDFYCHYFNAKSNEKYVNPAKQFSSYFLSFEDGDCRIELMHQATRQIPEYQIGNKIGELAHFAISVDSKMAVDLLTEQLRNDGYKIVGEPRLTGDGCYESIICDPDGNMVEITM